MSLRRRNDRLCRSNGATSCERMSRVLASTVEDHSKRMLATTNSLQTQIQTILSNTGISRDGRDWLVKALHPASPIDRLLGVPDGAVRMSTVPELLREITITAPGAVNWDCLVVTLNSDTVGALVFTRNSSTGYWKFWDATLPFSGANDCTSYTSLKSGVYEHAVAASNIGSTFFGVPYTIATGARQAANVSFGVDDCYTADQPSSWRTSAASTTVYMTASALYNGGTVTAGNFDALQGVSDSAFSLLSGGGETNVSVGRLFAAAARADFQIPMEVPEMLALNPGCFVGPACDGVYLPSSSRSFDMAVSRPRNQIAQGQFTEASQFWWTHSTGTIGAYIIDPVRTAAPSKSFGGVRMVDSYYRKLETVKQSEAPERTTFSSFMSRGLADANFGGDATFVGGLSTGIDNRHTGIMLFTGLSSSASLTVKTINVQELVPSQGAVSAEYLRAAPERDRVALDLYFETRARLPQAFPASFNSLGTILAAIKSALPVVIPHLKAGLRYVADTLAPRPPARRVIEQPGAPTQRVREVVVERREKRAKSRPVAVAKKHKSVARIKR